MPTFEYHSFMTQYPTKEASDLPLSQTYICNVPLKDWKAWEKYPEYKDTLGFSGRGLGQPISFINLAALAERIDTIETNGKKIAICFVNDHLQDVRKEVIEKLQKNMNNAEI